MKEQSSIWSRLKVVLIMAATFVSTFRICVAIFRSEAWYDSVIFACGAMLVAGYGAYLVAKNSKGFLFSIITWLIMLAIAGIWAGVEGGEQRETYAIWFSCLVWPAILGAGANDFDRRKHVRPLSDHVAEAYWRIRQFIDFAKQTGESPRMIRELQKANSILFPFTGMHSDDPEFSRPQSIKDIEEELAHLAENKEPTDGKPV